MSERDGYEPGVPCWVATSHPHPEQAMRFYMDLFGWETEDLMPPGASGSYSTCRLRGRDVAAVASLPPGAAAPAWHTYVWVERADDTATRVLDAGGAVVAEPFDLADAARIAVFADPAGAVFGVWQPGERRGAQLVNEPGAWSMSQLTTRDPDGAKAFYDAVFGWDTETFDMGSATITLWRVPGYVGGEPEQPVSRDVVAAMAPTTSDDVPPQWSVDFWVADSDAAAAKAEELGGKVIAPPFETPVGSTAVLADPQGAAFSVSQVTGGNRPEERLA